MNDFPHCLECDTGRLHPSTWQADFRHGDASVHVGELECYVCDQCGADPVFADQIRRNDRRIADARRQADGLLTGDEIHALRDHLGLTQQQAAMLFGGGANAFSKYERGAVIQSVPMDRLLRLVASQPVLLERLRELGRPGAASGRRRVAESTTHYRAP